MTVIVERELVIRLKVSARSLAEADRAFDRLQRRIGFTVPHTFLRSDSASPINPILGRAIILRSYEASRAA